MFLYSISKGTKTRVWQSNKNQVETMADTIIFHVDVNSAFLAWEASYRIRTLGESEDIRTFPSVIGGDETKRHGIVLAKSIPAKRFGITTGEPLANARKKCPGLKTYAPNFSLYVERSGGLISLLRSSCGICRKIKRHDTRRAGLYRQYRHFFQQTAGKDGFGF